MMKKFEISFFPAMFLFMSCQSVFVEDILSGLRDSGNKISIKH